MWGRLRARCPVRDARASPGHASRLDSSLLVPAWPEASMASAKQRRDGWDGPMAILQPRAMRPPPPLVLWSWQERDGSTAVTTVRLRPPGWWLSREPPCGGLRRPPQVTPGAGLLQDPGLMAKTESS